MTDTVVATREGRIGRLTLNRPKALNALDLPMIEALAAALDAWRDDPAVHAVVIEGAGERAFCAGGDIRAVRDHALAGEHDAIRAFFATEYALNQAIAEYPKPYVALIDGICMGGGIGVSVHGRIRIASEHAMLAMPETAIAMFPDVGGSYFLPRLPGRLGMYLGLTGTRVSGAEAVHAGLATHFVPRARLGELTAAIAADGMGVIAGFAEPLPPSTLSTHRAAIDHCFAANSVMEIVDRLRHDGSSWAEATLAELARMSPSAVLWSHEIIRRGASQTLAHCLAAELNLTRHVTSHPDFAEGVRAMVIDKDRNPHWSVATLAEVDRRAIAAMFAK
jgi:enoyl-CoA hydratase/carnithine racemase